VPLLKEHGAPQWIENTRGQTCLEYAQTLGRGAVEQKLLEEFDWSGGGDPYGVGEDGDPREDEKQKRRLVFQPPPDIFRGGSRRPEVFL
jgi:hypothetical protein